MGDNEILSERRRELPWQTQCSQDRRGEIPCHKVYEDDKVLAFPTSIPEPRHTLVVPKEPAETLDRLSDESAAALGRVLPRCAAPSSRPRG